MCSYFEIYLARTHVRVKARGGIQFGRPMLTSKEGVSRMWRRMWHIAAPRRDLYKLTRSARAAYPTPLYRCGPAKVCFLFRFLF
jgi:hypothetical protein